MTKTKKKCKQSIPDNRICRHRGSAKPCICRVFGGFKMMDENSKMRENIIEKINEKYFKLTGKSPKYSLWSFLDACGVGPNESALNDFYEEMEEYL